MRIAHFDTHKAISLSCIKIIHLMWRCECVSCAYLYWNASLFIAHKNEFYSNQWILHKMIHDCFGSHHIFRMISFAETFLFYLFIFLFQEASNEKPFMRKESGWMWDRGRGVSEWVNEWEGEKEDYESAKFTTEINHSITKLIKETRENSMWMQHPFYNIRAQLFFTHSATQHIPFGNICV